MSDFAKFMDADRTMRAIHSAIDAGDTTDTGPIPELVDELNSIVRSIVRMDPDLHRDIHALKCRLQKV